MGNRVGVVFKSGESYSPGIYMHWRGPEGAVEYLKNKDCKLRQSDMLYSAARFCGFCHTQLPGITGLGLLPTPAVQSDWGSDAWYDWADGAVIVVDVITGIVTSPTADKFRSFKIKFASE